MQTGVTPATKHDKGRAGGARRFEHQGHCAGQLPLMEQPMLHHSTATRATAVLPSASAMVPSCVTGRLAMRIEVSHPCPVPRRRDKTAAKKLFRQLLKGLRYVPRVIVTDKRRSYAAATRERRPGVERRQHH